MSFLDRTKKFQGSDPDSATNTEYLKNCVYHFMAAKEHSERRRLAPVISTILKLTAQEKKAIDSALQLSESNDLGGTIGAITSSSWGNLFGYSSPSPQSIGSGHAVVGSSSSGNSGSGSGIGSVSVGSFDVGDEDVSNGRKDGGGKNDASSSSLELSPPVPSLKGLRRARASEPSN